MLPKGVNTVNTIKHCSKVLHLGSGPLDSVRIPQVCNELVKSSEVTEVGSGNLQADIARAWYNKSDIPFASTCSDLNSTQRNELNKQPLGSSWFINNCPIGLPITDMAASVGLVQEAAHQLLGGEHPLLG